jgi:hypothetical protein
MVVMWLRDETSSKRVAILNHEDRVRQFMRTFLQAHGKLPTQKEIREGAKGSSILTTAAWRKVRNEPEFSSSEFEESFVIHNDTATLTTKIEHEPFPSSIDKMVERFDVDTSVWRVKDFKVKTWRGLIGNQESMLQDWIQINFERILSLDEEEKIKALKASFQKFAESYAPPKFNIISKPKGDVLLEPVFSDVHFGLHSWGEETGYDYDLKIAERMYKEAGENLYSKMRHYRADRILMPVGNDLLHVDNPHNTTTKGTPQHSDSRWQKAYDVALENVLWSIDLFASIAPVEVVLVPGNHAAVMEELLGKAIQIFYRNTTHVNVDVRPMPRKYHRWETVQIGLTHGHGEKKASLPMLMMNEAKPNMAELQCLEFHTGHYHTRIVEELSGVVVRTVSALALSDSWHNQKGYKGNLHAVEGFVFSRDGFESSYIGRTG